MKTIVFQLSEQVVGAVLMTLYERYAALSVRLEGIEHSPVAYPKSVIEFNQMETSCVKNAIGEITRAIEGLKQPGG